MSLETAVVQLTAQQISDKIFELSLKSFLSLLFLVAGIFVGKDFENEIRKYTGLILDVLGGLGLLVYLPQLIEIINIASKIK